MEHAASRKFRIHDSPHMCTSSLRQNSTGQQKAHGDYGPGVRPSDHMIDDKVPHDDEVLGICTCITGTGDSKMTPFCLMQLKINRRRQTHLDGTTHLSRRIHPRSCTADDSVVLPCVGPRQRARRTAHARESRLACLGGLANVASRPGPTVLARTTRRSQVRERGSIGQGTPRALKNGSAARWLRARRAPETRRTGAGGTVWSSVVFAGAGHIASVTAVVDGDEGV